MADYAQTQNVNNLLKFILEIPTRGVPEKVTVEYLSSIGMKSKNDRPIITVLKFLGVLDTNGAPTANYTALRHKAEAPKVLAGLIRACYAELFGTYPNAHAEETDRLRNWFSSRTKVGDASLRNILGTFTALCGKAEFDGTPSEGVLHAPAANLTARGVVAKGSNPVGHSAQICFNIQVHIPGEQKPDVYESIFKNLGKYVLGIQDDEQRSQIS